MNENQNISKNSTIEEKKKTTHHIEMKTEIQINASKKKVWDILADFGGVSKWNPMVSHSVTVSASKNGVNCERDCTIPQMGTLHERAVEWDEGNSMLIEVKGLAPNIKSNYSKWTLKGEGNMTIFTMSLDMELDGVEKERKEFEEQMRPSLKMVAQGLKHYAETGQAMPLPTPQ